MHLTDSIFARIRLGATLVFAWTPSKWFEDRLWLIFFEEELFDRFIRESSYVMSAVLVCVVESSI